MPPESYLLELKTQHRALESELSDALAHRSTADSRIAELKRRKLYLKDKIIRLQAQTGASMSAAGMSNAGLPSLH